MTQIGFIFVKDVIQANELVISRGDGNIFNVANGDTVSINELAELIIELTNSNLMFIRKGPRTGDISIVSQI